ncbi:MAG: sulfatase [Ramlibacter sp.]|nr:sulfatase [Ramlibacter sp.]
MSIHKQQGAGKKSRVAIVVMSDEHSGLAVSGQGHPWIKTPFIDEFARGASAFTAAYTNSPICIPARAAFTSGRYAHQTRNWDNAMPYTGEPRGWTHLLGDAGIDVTSIGKLHFRNEHDDTGFTRQLLPMHVVEGQGDVLGSVREPLPVRHKAKAFVKEIGIGESSYTAYDRSVAQASTEWIAEHAGSDKPWLLFASFVAPHFPLIAPEEFAKKYRLEDIPLPKRCHPEDRPTDHPFDAALRACFAQEPMLFDDDLRRRALLSYGALCSFMDWHFGQLCKAIEASGLADEALVIYTADHGDNMGARGLWGKSTMYEESARVPLLMRAPGRLLRPTVRTPVSLVDVGPTLLDWFGLPTPRDWPGRSLLDTAHAADDRQRCVFSEYHAAGAATGAFMLRRGNWKLIHYEGLAPQLFNLADDPEELHDLATLPEFAGTVEDLREELSRVADPSVVDAQAKADQRLLVEASGGREAVISRGGFGATPAPGIAPVFG